MEAFRRVDVVLHNAGIGTAASATRETPDQFRQVVDVNLEGHLLGGLGLRPRMQPGSSIINVSSVLGLTTVGRRRPPTPPRRPAC